MEGMPAQQNNERPKTYNVRLEGDVLKLSFGAPASNAEIVRDAISEIERLVASGELTSEKIIKLNGPASLPAAVAITNSISNLFEVIAVFDPKLNGYVVAISSDSAHEVGSILEAE